MHITNIIKKLIWRMKTKSEEAPTIYQHRQIVFKHQGSYYKTILKH